MLVHLAMDCNLPVFEKHSRHSPRAGLSPPASQAPMDSLGASIGGGVGGTQEMALEHSLDPC